MLRLLFSSKPKRVQHQLDAGELCMALPLAPLRAAGEQDKYFLATVVDYGKKKVVFFDDGSEMKIAVDAIAVASAADRDAAKFIYAAALDECKQLAAKDSEDIVAEAIEKVRAQMGGTLGGDGMISYTHSAGIEAKEGQLLLEALLANLGALAKQAPALRWMRSHWQEVCEQHDADKSGTISESEASGLWAQMTMTISSVIASKLDVLGTPPRLYRGDLCLATPEVASSAACSSAARSSAASRPAAAPELATYVDSTHVIFFDDSSDKVVGASSIQPATAAPKEQAILRYTMAVSQIKAIARKPSKAVVKDAIDKVRQQMGGTLGKDSAINYTQDAGEEAKEGQLLCAALLAHLGALEKQSRAAAAIAANWQVACFQADEDQSGTISVREAVAIWDRLLIEVTRSVTAKLDKLGVYPVPLLLERGDFCMVRPVAAEASSANPSKLYLATYVDPTHAVYFDDGSEVVHEVANVGPATEADKDVAIVKYTTALDQCTRLAGYDEEDIVSEAIEEVKSQLGAKGLGPKGKIDYMESAGEEAKEGRLLVEALLSNVGALWDESRSLRYMMDHWRDVCNEVDTDKSGTISEEEAAEIWDKVLTAFRQTVLKKLQQLGVVEKAIAKISTVATPPAQRL